MATKNIEIQFNTNGTNYDILYPKCNWYNMINTPTIPSLTNVGNCELAHTQYIGNGSNYLEITVSHTKTNCYFIAISLASGLSSVGSNVKDFCYGVVTLPNNSESTYTQTVDADGLGTLNKGVFYRQNYDYFEVKDIYNYNNVRYNMIVLFI